jgi:hypothetical protein
MNYVYIMVLTNAATTPLSQVLMSWGILAQMSAKMDSVSEVASGISRHITLLDVCHEFTKTFFSWIESH